MTPGDKVKISPVVCGLTPPPPETMEVEFAGIARHGSLIVILDDNSVDGWTIDAEDGLDPKYTGKRGWYVDRARVLP